MFSNKLLWSVLWGTTSGVIAAWLVFKFLEGSRSAGSNRAGEEITEGTRERDDQNNPAEKLPEENDERPENRAEEHEERRH